MSDRVYYSWEDVNGYVNELSKKIKEGDSVCGEEFVGIYGVPRGGVILAVILSHRLDIPYLTSLDVGRGGNGLLIVDDIADTGHTIERLSRVYDTATFATIDYNKEDSVVEPTHWINNKGTNDWIVYPWENTDSEEIQDYLTEPMMVGNGNLVSMPVRIKRNEGV